MLDADKLAKAIVAALMNEDHQPYPLGGWVASAGNLGDVVVDGRFDMLAVARDVIAELA